MNAFLVLVIVVVVIAILAGVLLAMRRARGEPELGTAAGPRRSGSERRPRPANDETGQDFADEHSSMTFGDERQGGPERAPEPEAPEGHGGMDIPRRRWLPRLRKPK